MELPLRVHSHMPYHIERQSGLAVSRQLHLYRGLMKVCPGNSYGP